jgi:hypothetical protein
LRLRGADGHHARGAGEITRFGRVVRVVVV